MCAPIMALNREPSEVDAEIRQMEVHVKPFRELTPEELYAIVKLRIDVFVVEQNCAYAELDDRDQEAVHVWIEDEGEIAAYLRVLSPGVESEYAALGRVISSRKKRASGYGARIMEEGIRVAQEMYGKVPLYLEAQVYAEGFYAKHGFRRISDAFLMDGIMHYKMLRDA